jgi:hypothetical protein
VRLAKRQQVAAQRGQTGIVADGGCGHCAGGGERGVERRLPLLRDMVAGAGVVGEQVGREDVEVCDAFGCRARLRVRGLRDEPREQTAREDEGIAARPRQHGFECCRTILILLRAHNEVMRVEPRAVATIVSVLLHLLVLFAFVTITARGVEPPPPSAEQELTAARLYGAGAQVVHIDVMPGLPASGLACTGSSYVGVGVIAEPGTERIILVGEDTPASRAGLQHDDIVLNPDVWQHAHREGALLHLLVLREGVKMAVSVLVGKICIG